MEKLIDKQEFIDIIIDLYVQKQTLEILFEELNSKTYTGED